VLEEPPPFRGGNSILVGSTAVPMWAGAAGFVCGCFGLAAIALAAGGNTQALGALFTGPLLLGIVYLIAKRIAAGDRDPQIVPILLGAFCVKLVGSVARYWVAASVYGTGDFYDYDKWGRRVAEGLRSGDLVDLPGRLAGTNFMRFVTGFIYLVTPSQMVSGFLVYGFLSFVGLIFFWRAYRVAISSVNDITYLKWVVLLPSLVYWPSAIGKDAFMVLAAGVAAYGAACLFAHRLMPGAIALAIGILGMVMVRPHFALAVCGGLILAALVRRDRGNFVQTIASVLFIVGVAFLVARSAASFFNLDSFSRESIVQTLSDASGQTAQGGSQFEPVVVSSPVQFPLAAVTVLYRPFPWETGSPQELFTALEGVVLAVLSIGVLRRGGRILSASRDHPYLLYCMGAILVFIIAFSGFSNFGILARQRAVIQPLFLVFIALPKDLERGLTRPDGLPVPWRRAEPARRGP
jgi:hypothetical protein